MRGRGDSGGVEAARPYIRGTGGRVWGALRSSRGAAGGGGTVACGSRAARSIAGSWMAQRASIEVAAAASWSHEWADSNGSAAAFFRHHVWWAPTHADRTRAALGLRVLAAWLRYAFGVVGQGCV